MTQEVKSEHTRRPSSGEGPHRQWDIHTTGHWSTQHKGLDFAGTDAANRMGLQGVTSSGKHQPKRFDTV